MTIEEKRKALGNFCYHRTTCEGCILYSQNCGFEALDDADVEMSYAIAYGRDEEIEALKAEIDRLTAQLAAARADAIMEFANRLCADYRDAYTVYGIEGLDDVMIMSIAKEMTEGENED